MNDQQFHSLVKTVFGMSDERYARFLAVSPGGGLDELIESITTAPKTEWIKICEDHAAKRAEEICTEYKSGDLFYRNGDYFWNMFWGEFDDAFKSVGCRRRRPFIEASQAAFTAAIECIRTRLLGPSEFREQLDFDKLEFSPSFDDIVKPLDRS